MPLARDLNLLIELKPIIKMPEVLIAKKRAGFIATDKIMIRQKFVLVFLVVVYLILLVGILVIFFR
jgi:hypothetical protein